MSSDLCQDIMKGRRVFVIPGGLRDRDTSLGMKCAPKECDQAVKAKQQGRRAVNGQIRPLALRFDPQVSPALLESRLQTPADRQRGKACTIPQRGPGADLQGAFALPVPLQSQALPRRVWVGQDLFERREARAHHPRTTDGVRVAFRRQRMQDRIQMKRGEKAHLLLLARQAQFQNAVGGIAQQGDGQRGTPAAHQLHHLTRRWCPTLPITLLGDTAYSILELGLTCQEQQVSLLTPFHLDAVLHALPPERDAHTIGRPRVVGSRLPSLEQILADPNTTWQRLTLEWYGQGERTLEICTGTALWYRAGFAPLPIRWSLETTFEESRAHLGIETQRQWSDLAIDRTTPLLFGLYSLVTLFGCALHPEGCIPVTHTAWYHKHTATFHDVLAEVRRHFWGNCSFSTSPTDPDVVFVPCLTLDRLTKAVCY